MPITTVDLHEVNTAIVAALQADATVKTNIGDPVRAYYAVPRNANTFPFLVFDIMPDTAIRKMKGGQHLREYRYEFRIVGNDNSGSDVGPAIKAVTGILDQAPDNLSITGAKCTDVTLLGEHMNHDPELKRVIGSISYQFRIEPT